MLRIAAYKHNIDESSEETLGERLHARFIEDKREQATRIAQQLEDSQQDAGLSGYRYIVVTSSIPGRNRTWMCTQCDQKWATAGTIPERCPVCSSRGYEEVPRG